MQLEVPVIGILRGIDAEEFGPLMQASFSAGLQALVIIVSDLSLTLLSDHQSK